MSASTRMQNPPKMSEVYYFLKGYFWKTPWMVLAAFALVSLTAVTSIFSPLVYGWLVDATTAAVGSRRMDDIMPPIYATIALSVLHHIFWRSAHFINCYTDTRVHAEIAAETVRKVHSFETEWHTNIFAGSIVTAIKRGRSSAHRIFDTFCYDFVPAGIAVIGSIYFAWTKSPEIAMSLVAYAVIFTVCSILLSLKYVAHKNRIYADEDSKLGGTVADSVTGYAAVKASGAEHHEYERVKKAADRFALAARVAWIRANILSFAQSMIINLFRFIAMFLAAKLWVDGTFTAGDVLFVLMNQRVIADYLDGIGNRIRDIVESINDLEEVVSWSNRRPLIANDDAHVSTGDLKNYALKFDNVTFRYTGQSRDAIADFNLDIEPGEKVALVGRTGSGKSTLFKLLHRYYQPQQGRITIDGHDISSIDLPGIRRQLSLVSQEPVLFHRTLAENIAYSNPTATMDDIRKAANMAQIGDLIESLPQKYETLVGERGIKLSGGERQRVAIARALLADARIILLDEATSALDNETEMQVQKALAALTHGRSVLAIAHRISTVQEFDRIIVMEMGRVIEQGKHHDLLARNGAYARLYNRHHNGEFLTENDTDEKTVNG